MTFPELSDKEKYLRFIENSLFFKGGKWIANFEIATRDFDISNILKEKKVDDFKKKLDGLIYGGVRGKGFILSRAFSFFASPTYVVACSVIDLSDVPKVKWSIIANWIRAIRELMNSMEFEWSWIVFFGQDRLPDKVLNHFERFNQRQIGLIYADIKNKKVVNSDGFIARRGATLFNPSIMDKKGRSIRFWRRNQ